MKIKGYIFMVIVGLSIGISEPFSGAEPSSRVGVEFLNDGLGDPEIPPKDLPQGETPQSNQNTLPKGPTGHLPQTNDVKNYGLILIGLLLVMIASKGYKKRKEKEQ